MSKHVFCLLYTYCNKKKKKIKCICFNEIPLKMMKNGFYLNLEAFFVLKTFEFLCQLFGYVEKTA